MALWDTFYDSCQNLSGADEDEQSMLQKLPGIVLRIAGAIHILIETHSLVKNNTATQDFELFFTRMISLSTIKSAKKVAMHFVTQRYSSN
jgi:hypothetical protein